MNAIVKKYQRTQSVSPGPAITQRAAQTSSGLLGDGLQQVGDMFQAFQDEVDTAAAKNADAELSSLIREELYGNETGFMYASGSDAVNRRASVSERIEARQKELLEGLNPAARAKAQSSLLARLERAREDIDRHTTGQGRAYLDAASDARIEAAASDAILNPDQVGQALKTGRQEILDKAQRNGWPPEATRLAIAEHATNVYGGVVERLTDVDPVRALEYLRENKDKMMGDEVARLEGILLPRVKEARGRAIGQQAAAAPWLTYTNQNAIRNDPISERLQSALSFLPSMGVTMEVFSGGQEDNQENGTGSTRHNHGHAADVFFYKDGRKLDWGNAADIPIFQEIVRRAKVNGVTGFGAGPGYMQQGSMHIGFGNPAVWGKDGAGANAPSWLVDAYQKTDALPDLAEVEFGGGLDAILAESDPDVRDAALSEYKLLTAARQNQAEAARQAAEDAAFRLIEGGGNINDIPQEYRESIGREAMSALRSYQEKIAAGTAVETSSQFYVQLMDQMTSDPEAFMRSDPMTWRDKLDDTDFQYFVKQRGDLVAGRRDPKMVSLSTLRTLSKNTLEAAGIDDAEQINDFERALVRWSEAETVKAGAAPSQVAIQDRINDMLVPIVIDPSGWGNKQSGSAFGIDYDGNALNPNDDLTPEMIRDGGLKINDQSVSNDMLELFANGFFDRFQRAPTVQEVVEGLIESGVYDE